ncbi:MAG: energy-coupling factor ABC transporter permease [Elusimicrobia bacterium]|nr:energy-coupling factor ABC transporter permease [Elusimicrobiota bacterium]
MHIPDGFIDAKTAIAAAALSAAGVGLALRQARRHMPRKNVPLMGLAAAFIFAAQMLNFPVGAGTSGHLIGAVLASVLLGPAAAVIVMTAVLSVQCLLFADGGVSALGANIFNMAVMGSIGGYGIYAAVHRFCGGARGRLLAAAFASWCSTVLASICCAGELACSGTVPWGAGFPAMAGVHMVIGLGEALITAMVIAAVDRSGFQTRENDQAVPAGHYGEILTFGPLIALGLALFVSPFASPWPDGLEKVAAMLGFEHKAAAQPVLASPFADYRIPGVTSAPAATAFAGAVGTVVVFLLSLLLARTLSPVSAERRPAAQG